MDNLRVQYETQRKELLKTFTRAWILPYNNPHVIQYNLTSKSFDGTLASHFFFKKQCINTISLKRNFPDISCYSRTLYIECPI